MIGEETGISIALAIALVAAVVGAWHYVNVSIRAAEEKAQEKRDEIEDDVARSVSELHGRITALKDDLSRFKLEVANSYASDERLRITEEKLTAAIDKLVNRFDKFAADFHLVVGRIEARGDRPSNAG